MKTGKVGKVAAGSKRKAGGGGGAKRAGKAGGQPQRPVKKQKKVQALLLVHLCLQQFPLRQLAGQVHLQNRLIQQSFQQSQSKA